MRYWWVAIKLGLNIILSTLIVTALRGEVAKAADLGSQLAAGVDLDWNFSNMLFPPIVSPTALTVAFLLAVFKPWGRIRRNRAGRGEGGSDSRLPRAHGGSHEGLAVLRQPALDVGVAQAKWQAGRNHELGSIHDLEVHVRLAGIAGVAALRQLCTRVNMLTGADEDRSPTQVGHRGVRVIAEVEDDMVTEQSLRPSQLAKCASITR